MTIKELNDIACDIHRAMTRDKSKLFVTTKQKQIEFMYYLYGQGFTHEEIGKIYKVPAWKVADAFRKYIHKKKNA